MADLRRFNSFLMGQKITAPMATTIVASMPSKEPNTLIPAPGPI
ncbi:MAG: hypothetical protein PVJ33_03200 [Lysobacterales bacterium]